MTLVTDGHDAGRPPAALKLGPPQRPPPRPQPKAVASAPQPGARFQPAPAKRTGIPAEAEFIISALEAGSFAGANRRKSNRYAYRVSASLKLYSDHAQAPPWALYVRDVGTGGLGFVTRHRLPLGYGGILSIRTPDGRTAKIDCTLLRCREAIQGWFEGSMYFNRPQPAFDNLS